MNNNKTLWVDKHNPTTIDECVLPSSLKDKFNSIIQSNTLPNLLLTGDAGMGKTTVAKLLCSQLELDVLEINASLNRGIDTIRKEVLAFATTTSLTSSYKVVLLDEADNLTEESQKSLRGLVEKVQQNCRFILTANYPQNLISPLRSRFTELAYRQEDKEELLSEMLNRVQSILTEEGVSYEEEKENLLPFITHLYPNWRQVIHQLQSSSLSGSLHLHLSVEKATPEELIKFLSTKDVSNLVSWVEEHLSVGRNTSDLCSLLTTEALRVQPPHKLPTLIFTIASCESMSVTEEKRRCLNTVLQVMNEW